MSTETLVWERLLADGNSAILLVSHRPHVLERADRVVVMDDGRVIEVVEQ